MLPSPNFVLENLSPQLGTNEQHFEMLSEGLSAQVLSLLTLSVFPMTRFCSLSTLNKMSSDTPNKSPVFNPETSYPSESSFLQLTSYLSVAGPFSITKHRVYSAEKNNVGTIIPSL
jgi:hypothetical protein